VTADLVAFTRRELAIDVAPEVRSLAAALAADGAACAVLFYGSNLRTGELGGILDFYLLTAAPHRRGWRGLLERWLWPEVSYRELQVGETTLRAKVATLPMTVFRRAAEGRAVDTTVWARFVQPCALVWVADPATADAVADAVAAACATAGRYAAVLGPGRGTARAYWTALFRRTYATELRVEEPGREGQIVDFQAGRYEQLLPLAWAHAGTPFTRTDGDFRPDVPASARRTTLAAWRRRRWLGKPLNAARLVKAAFTFEGAARYAAWKIERHTGLQIAVTPWRERHPILAAPGVLWRLARARSRQPDAR
jgi:hypothetical protein